MKLHPRLSRAAVELVKRFETFEPHARPAPQGGWTIGYGHTRTAREGASVSRQDAEALLLYDLSAAAELVTRTVFAPLNTSQFEALTAFAFNVGPENFRGSSALARVNAGAYLDAADEIERWRLAELGAGAQVVDALVRRRAAEKAHFLNLPHGAATSTSTLLRPLTGPDAGPMVSGAPTAASSLAAVQGAGVPVEAAGEPSATLTAANSVQARLRELIPDVSPTADAPAEKAHDAPPPPVQGRAQRPPLSATPFSTAFGVAAPLMAAGGMMGVAEPPPPPFANDRHAPAAADPLSEEGLDAPAETGNHEPATPDHASAQTPAPAQAKAAPGAGGSLLRFIPHLLGLIGLILFAGAAAAILKGLPTAPTLGVGLVGAVLMAVALYKLMGRPTD